MKNNKQVLFVGAALAGLLLANGCAHNKKQESTEPSTEVATGECHGINSCKGKGDCGGKGYSCAGKNACKGKGWLKMTQADCAKKGGKFKAN